MVSYSEKKKKLKPRIETKLTNQEIQDVINKTEINLFQAVINYQHITSKELVSWFEDEAPSGDITTLSDILTNKWLLIHELVELSELKNMGFKISSQLLRTHATEVDYAHITATEYELKFAKEDMDLVWINSRLKHVDSWIKEDEMPKDLINRCLELLRLYSG